MPLSMGVSLAKLSLIGGSGLLLSSTAAVAQSNHISLKQLMVGLEPAIQLPTPLQPVSESESESEPDSRRHFSEGTAKSFSRTSQPFPSLASAPLDAQLRRYLSYLEAVGPADIFVVGSSRATQGVDPLVLQQVLANRGFEQLKVFNWGIHGATAQVVELLLSEILMPEQLPRLIIWADGSRSFSRGRYDQTYENIRRSPGYRALLRGQRPFLTPMERQQLHRLQTALEVAPPPFQPRQSQLSRVSQPPVSQPPVSRPPGSQLKWQSLKMDRKLGPSALLQPALSLQTAQLGLRLAQSPPRFLDWCVEQQGPCHESGPSHQPVIRQPVIHQVEPPLVSPEPQRESREYWQESSKSSVEFNSRLYLEASGFQSNTRQFNPQYYFQRHRHIPGSYDGDYKNFSLWGHQHESLQRTLRLARQQELAIVFVNMPLTQLYLDPVRKRGEAAFLTYMNQAAQTSLLTFHDFSRLWPKRHEFFIDPSHVNRYGAESVAWELGKRLDQSLLSWLNHRRHSRPLPEN